MELLETKWIMSGVSSMCTCAAHGIPVRICYGSHCIGASTLETACLS